MIIDTFNFQDKIEETEFAIVKFMAEWCGPCKRYAPIFESFAEKHPEIGCFSVDCEASKELAEEYHIMSIPATIVFKNGEMIKQKQGILSVEDLEKVISGE